jgi:hypothetical protein
VVICLTLIKVPGLVRRFRGLLQLDLSFASQVRVAEKCFKAVQHTAPHRAAREIRCLG